jgi:hypothetical protein
VAAASGAFKLIRESIEMFNQGRSVVQEVLDDAKNTYDEVQGAVGGIQELWNSLKGLFGIKVKESTKPAVKPTAKPKKKVKPNLEFDENAIYVDVSKALMQFFKARNALNIYIKEEEERSNHVFDNVDEGSENAVNLVMAELQMEKMSLELREFMVYHVGPEFKDLYSRINSMLGNIAEKQELARMEELQKEREARWRRRQMADQIKNRTMYAILTLAMIGWVWMTIMVMTRSIS